MIPYSQLIGYNGKRIILYRLLMLVIRGYTFSGVDQKVQLQTFNVLTLTFIFYFMSSCFFSHCSFNHILLTNFVLTVHCTARKIKYVFINLLVLKKNI